MIEEIIPGNKTKLNILRIIYENPEINLTALIKKTKASPNLVLYYANKLSAYNIIKEKISKGKKKVHQRNLMPNFNNETSQILYSLIELNKRDLFFQKYKDLKPYLAQLEELMTNKIDFILVYGSYARFSASEESDLDILIVGKPEKEKIARIKEIFVTFNRELSLKLETLSQFLKNKNKPLYLNILKEHIILTGTLNFIKTL